MRDLGHALGAGDVAERRLEQIGIAILKHGVEIGGDVLFGLKTVGGVPTAGLAGPVVLAKSLAPVRGRARCPAPGFVCPRRRAGRQPASPRRTKYTRQPDRRRSASPTPPRPPPSIVSSKEQVPKDPGSTD